MAEFAQGPLIQPVSSGAETEVSPDPSNHVLHHPALLSEGAWATVNHLGRERGPFTAAPWAFLPQAASLSPDLTPRLVLIPGPFLSYFCSKFSARAHFAAWALTPTLGNTEPRPFPKQ